MRKIRVVNPQSDAPVDLETSVRTWGELSRELSAKGIAMTGMKGIVRTTNVSLEMPDAVLPEGDCTIFLFTAKVKSGGFTKAQVEQYKLTWAKIKNDKNQFLGELIDLLEKEAALTDSVEIDFLIDDLHYTKEDGTVEDALDGIPIESDCPECKEYDDIAKKLGM